MVASIASLAVYRDVEDTVLKSLCMQGENERNHSSGHFGRKLPDLRPGLRAAARLCGFGRKAGIPTQEEWMLSVGVPPALHLATHLNVLGVRQLNRQWEVIMTLSLRSVDLL